MVLWMQMYIKRERSRECVKERREKEKPLSEAGIWNGWWNEVVLN